jgi:hypothetical protein
MPGDPFHQHWEILTKHRQVGASWGPAVKK